MKPAPSEVCRLGAVMVKCYSYLPEKKKEKRDMVRGKKVVPKWGWNGNCERGMVMPSYNTHYLPPLKRGTSLSTW